MATTKVGDLVEVPGGMHGTVKFIGPVHGKKGVFAGVQLATEYAPRGKNSGQVDGKHYFRTTIPGAGIFLPLEKAVKKTGGPATPRTPSLANFNQGGRTSLASLPKPSFSQSIGPGSRDVSPAARSTVRRESLPRPSSPLRKAKTPAANKLTTPKTRPSLGLAKSTLGNGPQYRASPAMKSNKFSQSLRQSSVTPAKKPLSPLGPEASFDEEADAQATPTPTPAPAPAVRSLDSTIHEQEIKRLKASLEDRDRQLRDQAASIVEMEKSLVELQALLPDGDPPPYRKRSHSPDDRALPEDVVQLRATVREKNEKIKSLTTEFDANRADFRSTIDTLEMASTETERVYEQRVDELLEQVSALQEMKDRTEDVESVAIQLKGLEELVAELEEGLEDARRGEAEARGEVEFLRGEVERGREEFRREKEKNRTERALNGNSTQEDDEQAELSLQIDQKDDEIRGLKVIIHSLQREPNVHSEDASNASSKIANELQINSMKQQIKDLETLLDRKAHHESDLEREISRLRLTSSSNRNSRNSSNSNPSRQAPPRNSSSDKHRSAGTMNGSLGSHRLSDRTVVPVPTLPHNMHDQQWHDTASSAPGSPARDRERERERLETMHEDIESTTGKSSVTDTSSVALWCEICETSGHDILGCAAMMTEGNGDGSANERSSSDSQRNGRDAVREGLKDMLPTRRASFDPDTEADNDGALTRPRPIVNRRSTNTLNGDRNSMPKAPAPAEPLPMPPPLIRTPSSNNNFNYNSVNGNGNGNSNGNGNGNGSGYSNGGGGGSGANESLPLPPPQLLTSMKFDPNATGMVAGKSSRVVDTDRWCALCERDGHESVDCPFEDAF